MSRQGDIAVDQKTVDNDPSLSGSKAPLPKYISILKQLQEDIDAEKEASK